MASVPHLRGVAANLNPLRTNRILGPSTWTLAGDPHLTEEILGARFRLAPDAFFQVNPEQVAVLYALALDCVGADPFAVGFDLYAGVGALAILLSRKVTAVHAVEALPAAVTEGRSNAQRNRAPVTFHEGLAEIVVPELVSRGVIPDVIVLDPPRSGVRPEVLEAIVQSGARRLVYISCEPETMARDLARLSHRYRLERVIPVDLFPRTDHVETVCRLSLNLVPPVPQPISQCNHHDEPDSHDEPNAL
jgi:23S rRNA (uracil1939-C5)-methyltransferase